MSLISGSITYRKFRVADELPRTFKEDLVQRLPRHAFREINPQTNPELSIGWTNPFDQLDARVALEKVLFGKYIILGMRKDRKTVQPALFKAKVREAMRAAARERKGRKLSREEIAGLKDTVKEKLLVDTSPTSTFFEMVWNYETQEVWFSSQASKPSVEFQELFEETFQLALEEVNLLWLTERYILEKGLSVELADLEPATFAA